MVQLSVMSQGALRMSANELKADVDFINGQIEEILRANNK
jgi:predicted RNA-binding protein with PIN domain